MTTEKFLEFNGKKLTLVNAEGKFYIALKPICEVLNVDYIRQFKNLKEDKLLSQLLSNQTTVGADGRQREMICLPEKYIYGWLFSINSQSEELNKYKLECYDVLYSHFHNVLSDRMNELQVRTDLKTQYQTLHKQKMVDDPEYKRLVEIQQQLKAVNNNLNNYDSILLNGQMKIAFE